MSRDPLPFAVTDLSELARSLHRQLAGSERTPSHVELLNMLARAAGRRNYQHFRRDLTAGRRLAEPAAIAPAADRVRTEKALRHFDAEGRLLRWPARASLQELCFWVLWSRLPSRAVLTDRQISLMLQGWHGFGDHALLRRALVDYGLVTRTVDGREYRRVEQPPPPELKLLLAQLGGRRAA